MAEEYVVLLEDASTLSAPGGPAPTVLAELPFSSLRWGRVGGEVSVASVVLSRDARGRSCCPYPFHGWDQLLTIYRNGERVWSGPLVGWQRNGGQITLIGHDLMAFTKKAFVAVNRTFTGVDAATLLGTLMSDASTALGSLIPWQNINPVLMPEYDGFGATLDRTYAIAQMKSIWEVLQEMRDEASLVFSCGATRAYYDTFSPYIFNFGQGSPVLSETTVLNDPDITVDCLDVASDVFVLGASGGPGGFQSIYNASMVAYLSATPYSEHFTMQTRTDPDQRTGGEAQTGVPVAVATLVPAITIETLYLSPSFGSLPGWGSPLGSDGEGGFDGINSLMPGLTCPWQFDADCLANERVTTLYDWNDEFNPYWESDGIRRTKLEQVNVSVEMTDEGLSESIAADFIPWVDRDRDT